MTFETEVVQKLFKNYFNLGKILENKTSKECVIFIKEKFKEYIDKLLPENDIDITLLRKLFLHIYEHANYNDVIEIYTLKGILPFIVK